MNIKFKICLVFFLALTVSCGFKVVDQSQRGNFYAKEILTTGDKRVNFQIKSNLAVLKNKNKKNIILLEINTKKNKSIKEKNIKNEITKYEISLDTNIKFEKINSKRKYEKTVTVLGDYLISKNTSTTLSNERKLIENLADQISDQIMETISLKLNDN